MVYSSEFWYAPIFSLCADTLLMAASSWPMALVADSRVATFTFVMPREPAVMSPMSSARSSPLFAPTWNTVLLSTRWITAS